MPRESISRKSKYWMFTMFDEEVNAANLLNMVGVGAAADYIIFQQERCPTTNRVHWQGYVEFKTRRTLSAAKRYFPGDTDPHLDSRRGTAQQARDYCSKTETRISENFYEKGTISSGKSIKDLVKENASLKEIFEAHPTTFIRSSRGIKEAKDLYVQPRKVTDPFNIIVLLGLTGHGKTYKAYQLDKDLFRADLHQPFPFDKYNYQKTILLDDYRNQITYTKLLEILDIYKDRVNVKHDATKWCVENVIITSVRPVKEWHSKIPDKSELYRRIRQYGEIYKMIDRVPYLCKKEVFLDDPLDSFNFSSSVTQTESGNGLAGVNLNYDYE